MSDGRTSHFAATDADVRRRVFDDWWKTYSTDSAMAQKGVRMDGHMEIATWRAFCCAWEFLAENPYQVSYRDAFEDGAASRQPEIDRLEAERA